MLKNILASSADQEVAIYFQSSLLGMDMVPVTLETLDDLYVFTVSSHPASDGTLKIAIKDEQILCYKITEIDGAYTAVVYGPIA